MSLKIASLFLLCTLCYADDSKWVWDKNNRNEKSEGSLRTPGLKYEKSADPRYEVVEGPDFGPSGPGYGNGPSGPEYGNRPGYGPNRPLRPGGSYGQAGLNGYGDYDGFYPDDDRDPGILTGPVPSWIKQGPFKEYDTCKCTEKFNCKSPGISYGQCDVGKKYCCYNKHNVDFGSAPPSRPIHSPENGVLVGPGAGGPVVSVHQRPGEYELNRPGYGGPGGGYGRPGGYERPGGVYGRPGGGYGRPGGSYGRPGGNYGRPGGNYGKPGAYGNVYSPENGVLVGPDGPYDIPPGRPQGGVGYDNYGRSAKKSN